MSHSPRAAVPPLTYLQQLTYFATFVRELFVTCRRLGAFPGFGPLLDFVRVFKALRVYSYMAHTGAQGPAWRNIHFLFFGRSVRWPHPWDEYICHVPELITLLKLARVNINPSASKLNYS